MIGFHFRKVYLLKAWQNMVYHLQLFHMLERNFVEKQNQLNFKNTPDVPETANGEWTNDGKVYSSQKGKSLPSPVY